MNRYLAGMICATVAFVAGLWLVLAPFAIGFQHGRHGWRADTRIDVFTGAGVAAVAAMSFLAWGIAWRRRLRADGVLPERVSTPPAEAPPGDLEELLRPLVAALAADQTAARDCAEETW